MEFRAVAGSYKLRKTYSRDQQGLASLWPDPSWVRPNTVHVPL